MADESKAGDSPLSSLVVPNPPTVRGKPAKLRSSPDGTLLLYFSGNNAIVRSFENPSQALCFTKHQRPITAITMSPDGSCVASGDDRGQVLVWSFEAKPTVLFDHETAIGGAVADIDFSADGKSLVVVGEGGLNARIFVIEDGSTLSDFTPFAKPFLSASYSKGAVARIAMANEDMSVSVYGGEAPFADPIKVLRDHKNYVNCVRFNPAGDTLATVSSDKAIFLYNAETLEQTGKIKKAHAGSIYNCAWSDDGSRLVTSSADKSVKVWDVATQECVASFVMGKAVDFMQVGVVCGPKTKIMSLSLSGALNVLDSAAEDAAPQVISSHQGGVKALSRAANGDLLGAFMDGSVYKFVADESGLKSVPFTGEPPRADAIATAGDSLAVCGVGAKLAFASVSDATFSATAKTEKTGTSLAAFAAGDDVVTFVVLKRKLLTFVNGAAKGELALKYDATCAACDGAGTTVAVGGADKKVHFYTVGEGYALKADGASVAARDAITCAAVSGDGKYLAAGDVSGDIRLYLLATRELKVKKLWTNHSSRITSLAWNASSTKLASSGMDVAVRTWDPERGSKSKAIEDLGASQIQAVCWDGDSGVWCGNKDGLLRRLPL